MGHSRIISQMSNIEHIRHFLSGMAHYPCWDHGFGRVLTCHNHCYWALLKVTSEPFCQNPIRNQYWTNETSGTRASCSLSPRATPPGSNWQNPLSQRLGETISVNNTPFMLHYSRIFLPVMLNPHYKPVGNRTFSQNRQ